MRARDSRALKTRSPGCSGSCTLPSRLSHVLPPTHTRAVLSLSRTRPLLVRPALQASPAAMALRVTCQLLLHRLSVRQLPQTTSAAAALPPSSPTSIVMRQIKQSAADSRHPCDPGSSGKGSPSSAAAAADDDEDNWSVRVSDAAAVARAASSDSRGGNYYRLFHLDPRFAIDQRLLKRRFTDLQRLFHPDKFAASRAPPPPASQVSRPSVLRQSSAAEAGVSRESCFSLSPSSP